MPLMSKKAMAIHFATLDTGCFVPTNFRLNSDGYFRKRWPGENDNIEMFHRFVYRAHHGEHSIPQGFEIDHICKVRACCNIAHLRALEGSAHAIVSNQDRYAERCAEAHKHWILTRSTGVALGARFGVSFSTGNKWIRQWKA